MRMREEGPKVSKGLSCATSGKDYISFFCRQEKRKRLAQTVHKLP